MDTEKTIESKVEQPDLSQKTVVVLVILTVLISVLGTIAVLSQVNMVKTYSEVKTSGSQVGQVQLTILKPGEKPNNAPSESITTGRVALNILPPKK